MGKDDFDHIEDTILSILEEENQSFIFLTGAAGTGKSTMLEHIRNQLELKKMIVAPVKISLHTN